MFSQGMNPTRAVVFGICAMALFGVLAVSMSGGSGSSEDVAPPAQMLDERTVPAAEMTQPSPEIAETFEEADSGSSPEGFDPVAEDPQSANADPQPDDASANDGPAMADVSGSASDDQAAPRPDKSAEE